MLALASRVVPESSGMDEESQGRFLAIVDQFLDRRPWSLRLGLKVFLGLLKWAPVLRYGAAWDRLPARQRDLVLSWFQDSRWAAVRRGFWGVRTLVFLGYYGQAELWERFGYKPLRRGNVLLGAGNGRR